MSRADNVGDQFVEVSSGIWLCYRTAGDPSAEPVVLIAGLAQQLHAWPQSFIDGLVGEEFYVITLDNRDAGRSSRSSLPAPSKLRLLLGRPRPDAYTLADMAGDVAELLDHLGLDEAHVVGQSMGGMIAQTFASLMPSRVRTLVSLYSTTGGLKVGQARLQTKLRLAAPPPRNASHSVNRHLAMIEYLAGPGFPMDPAAERAYAALAWERGSGANPDGMARQVQAIVASGDRTAMLRSVTAPTLVINGDRDFIVDPSGGTATAAAIRRAKHLVVPGMGHHIAPTLEAQLIGAIMGHARPGSARSLDA